MSVASPSRKPNTSDATTTKTRHDPSYSSNANKSNGVTMRIQEKKTLAGLNDRLASYIERVRHLESANRSLNNSVVTHEESFTEEKTKIREVFEEKLQETRKREEENAKTVAKLRSEANVNQAKIKELQKKLDNANSELSNFESQNNDLLGKFNRAENQKRHLEMKYSKLQGEIDAFEKALEEARKRADAEALRRIELETKNRNLEERLELNSKIHSQELEETRTRTQVHIDELDGKLRKNYENQINDFLQETREKNNSQLANCRREAQAMYNEKVEKFERQIKDLEEAIRCEKAEHARDVDTRDKEIQDLHDAKMTLQVEIDAYRMLLDSEEKRLSTTSLSEDSHRPVSFEPIMTSSTKKRKVAPGLSDESNTVLDVQTSKYCKGPVEIKEINEAARYIKLSNKTEKSVAIGGWQLKLCGGSEDSAISFHRTLIIKAGDHVTVWDSTSGGTHAPPQNVVMKNQNWNFGENIKAILFDNKGQEIAMLKRNKRGQV